jgi:ribokinase
MTPSANSQVTFLGIFAADLSFRAVRLPCIGETLIASDFAIGAGGKGSNQAVACARSGGQAAFLTRIGRDAFGELALQTWHRAGVVTDGVETSDDKATGAAFIFVDEASGQNAIIVNPGAAREIDCAFVERARNRIAGSRVFASQLEQPIDAALRGLQIAREGRVITVLNPAPAPASVLPDEIWPLCDVVVPNEVEASMLTGINVDGPQRAIEAADVLISKGASSVILTLGVQGVLLRTPTLCLHLPPAFAGSVRDTTGAGDAFIGGLCTALAEGRTLTDSAHFANAVAGISVTRPGTAASMPARDEIDRLLKRLAAT